MLLKLLRKNYANDSTIGELYLDGVFECYTLEDKTRARAESEGKIPGRTAIPAGCYQVDLTYSKRFGRILPLVMGVPNFEGIRIHNGNTAADTEGCILVGQTKGHEFVGKSVAALQALLDKLVLHMSDTEGTWIDIQDTKEIK